MKLKYVGMNPVCKEIQDATEEYFDGSDIEVPKKIRLLRQKGIGPGTFVDWMAIGYHPTAKTTVTLLLYFHTQQEGFDFIDNFTTWQDLLISKGM